MNNLNSDIARIFYLLPPLLGLISVAAGAFGAHALQNMLPDKNISWWQTASDYMMYHSLASLFTLAFYHSLPSIRYCCTLFSIGSLLFCGSLFFMALTSNKSLAILTPIGGLFFLAGWCYMIWLFLRLKTKTTS